MDPEVTFRKVNFDEYQLSGGRYSQTPSLPHDVEAILAEKNGVVLAEVIFQKQRFDQVLSPPRIFIYRIDSDWERRGFGSKLVDMLEEEARQQGVVQIGINISSS